MTKVKPNNGNETKSDIFPWDIFKSDVISFFIKKYYSILVTFKIENSQVYASSETKKCKRNKL